MFMYLRASQAKSTKFWITSSGKCLLCNNNSKIPNKALRIVKETIEARSSEIVGRWLDYFGEVSYYC